MQRYGNKRKFVVLDQLLRFVIKFARFFDINLGVDMAGIKQFFKRQHITFNFRQTFDILIHNRGFGRSLFGLFILPLFEDRKPRVRAFDTSRLRAIRSCRLFACFSLSGFSALFLRKNLIKAKSKPNISNNTDMPPATKIMISVSSRTPFRTNQSKKIEICWLIIS